MRKCHAAGYFHEHGKPVLEVGRDFLVGLLIFLAVFALAALDARPARPEPARAAPAPAGPVVPASRTPTLADATTGALLVRPAQSQATAPLAFAPLIDTDVEIDVSGPVARARVTQTFRNDGKARLTGRYVLPLPTGATVDSLSMHVGERTIKGEIKRRADIRKMCRPGRRTGPRAGLTDQHDDRFTTPGFDIGPGETVTVRIAYQQTLRFHDGGYSLRFPLAAARMTPPSPPAESVHFDATNKAADSPATLQVRIEAGFPLGRIASATHALAVKRRGDDRALVTFADGPVPAGRDFQLTWRPKATATPAARLLRERGEKADYLLAMITPPEPAPPAAAPAREMILVVDASAAMAGERFAQTRKSLEAAIARLGERDRFNLIAFDSGVRTLFDAAVEASAGNKETAKTFVSRLYASGAPNMMPALIAALKDATPDDATRIRQVVLITGGALANEQQLISEIAVKRGRSRLFLAGVGPAPDGLLLRRAAEVGRGGFIHVGAGDRLAESLDRFLTRLEQPALTDIRIDWPNGVQTDSWPDPLPDVYAGEPLVVTVRASALKGPLTLRGNLDGKPWTAQFKPGDIAGGTGIARLWARRKIATLEARRSSPRERDGIDQEIEKVSLEHRLVSRMTGLVAVDRTAVRPRGDEAPLASEEVPPVRGQGQLDDETPGDAVVDSTEMPTGAIAKKAAGQVPAVKAAPRPETRTAQLRLPADRQTPMLTETDPAPQPGPQSLVSGRLGIVAVMALVFAAMSALTLGMWRHLRQLYVSPRRRRRPV